MSLFFCTCSRLIKLKLIFIQFGELLEAQNHVDPLFSLPLMAIFLGTWGLCCYLVYKKISVSIYLNMPEIDNCSPKGVM